MAVVVYLDTHVVAWLYAAEIGLLTDTARRLIRDNDVLISPIVRLELQYLFEIGRTSIPAGEVINDLSGSIGLQICHQPIARVIEKAERESWTRDPFDRIIVAQASLSETTLVTKDEAIHQHYNHATW